MGAFSAASRILSRIARTEYHEQRAPSALMQPLWHVGSITTDLLFKSIKCLTASKTAQCLYSVTLRQFCLHGELIKLKGADLVF